jgi:hypothetical protein
MIEGSFAIDEGITMHRSQFLNLVLFNSFDAHDYTDFLRLSRALEDLKTINDEQLFRATDALSGIMNAALRKLEDDINDLVRKMDFFPNHGMRLALLKSTSGPSSIYVPVQMSDLAFDPSLRADLIKAVDGLLAEGGYFEKDYRFVTLDENGIHHKRTDGLGTAK